MTVKRESDDPHGTILSESYRFGQGRTASGLWHSVSVELTPANRRSVFYEPWRTACGQMIKLTNVRDDQPHRLVFCTKCYRKLSA